MLSVALNLLSKKIIIIKLLNNWYISDGKNIECPFKLTILHSVYGR